jgi:hypothetical protein
MENNNMTDQQVKKEDLNHSNISILNFRQTLAGRWEEFPYPDFVRIYREEPSPEMADQCMEVITALVHLEMGNPICIVCMHSRTWAFRSDGVLDSKSESTKTMKSASGSRKPSFKNKKVEYIPREDVIAIFHLIGLKWEGAQ